MLIRFFTTVNRFPKTILLIILALSAFFFYQAKEGLFDPQTGKIRINSTVEPFIERDSGAYQQFLEARDAFAPQLQSLLKYVGDLMVVLLTNVLGRAIGLVGKGIAQGMGRTISR